MYLSQDILRTASNTNWMLLRTPSNLVALSKNHFVVLIIALLFEDMRCNINVRTNESLQNAVCSLD